MPSSAARSSSIFCALRDVSGVAHRDTGEDLFGVRHLLGETLRAARSGRPALDEPRHDRGTQKIAVVLEARVRGVLEPTKIPGARLRDDLGPARAKQRACEPTPAEWNPVANRAQAAYAGAAQEPQQHRLELVVAVVCRQQQVARGQEVGERGITSLSRGGFETRARAALDRDTNRGELDAERASRRLAVRAPDR
jgi:hypothetical protein